MEVTLKQFKILTTTSLVEKISMWKTKAGDFVREALRIIKVLA